MDAAESSDPCNQGGHEAGSPAAREDCRALSAALPAPRATGVSGSQRGATTSRTSEQQLLLPTAEQNVPPLHVCYALRHGSRCCNQHCQDSDTVRPCPSTPASAAPCPGTPSSRKHPLNRRAQIHRKSNPTVSDSIHGEGSTAPKASR